MESIWNIYWDWDEDILFLPLHSMAIFYCIENLHNLNEVQSALMAARTQANVLRKEA